MDDSMPRDTTRATLIGPEDALIGREIPPYRIVRHLGSGGMGRVYVAERDGPVSCGRGKGFVLEPPRLAAVKFFMPRDPDTDMSAARSRFGNEALIGSSIESPHTVRVLHHGAIEGAPPFIVMELLIGIDLSRRIRQVEEAGGSFPLYELAAVIRQAANALADLRVQKIVHRDVKPSNLFIVEHAGYSMVKLLDFGAAQRQGTLGEFTRAGGVIGTDGFMSPEHAFVPRETDWQADLWSLAATAYRALVGVVPFDHAGLKALYKGTVTGPGFVLPSARRAGIPPALDAWFMRAFRRDVRERFGDAHEMASVLREAVRSVAAVVQPSTVAATSPAHQVLKPVRPAMKPVSRAWRSAGVLAVIGMASFAFLLDRPPLDGPVGPAAPPSSRFEAHHAVAESVVADDVPAPIPSSTASSSAGKATSHGNIAGDTSRIPTRGMATVTPPPASASTGASVLTSTSTSPAVPPAATATAPTAPPVVSTKPVDRPPRPEYVGPG